MATKAKLKVVRNKKRDDNFQRLIDILMEEGYDIWFSDNQTIVSIYMSESGWSLRLDLGGSWSIE